MDNRYRVERHFGARGWLDALWMDWRRRSGCTLPCDCMTCSIYKGAINEWDKVTNEWDKVTND
jgi:hypothetical protein